MADVRMIVSAQTIQEYVRFFRNSSTVFWTVSRVHLGMQCAGLGWHSGSCSCVWCRGTSSSRLRVAAEWCHPPSKVSSCAW